MPEQFKKASILETMTIDLSKAEEDDLNQYINTHREQMSTSRQDFMDRQKKYLLNYDDYITYDRKGPWEESANLHMPLTAVMLNSYHSKLYNIFTGPNAVVLRPRESMDEKRADTYKKLREWYLWDHINEYTGIKTTAFELFQDVCTVGYGVVFKSWQVKQRKYIEIVENEFDREMEEVERVAEEAAAAGEKFSTKPYKEVEKILTSYEGGKVQTIAVEDILFPNKVPRTSDLDYPPVVIVSDTMDASELMLGVKQGKFKKEAADKIIEGGVDENSHRTQEADIKQLKSDLSGYNDQYYSSRNIKRQVEYVFCRYDIDKDGIDEELVVTRSPGGDLLCINYLDRLTKTGMRPLVKFDCFPKSRQAYSRGVVEKMYSLNEEMDRNHNMRQDYLQLQTCPFGTYKSGSSLDNQEIRIAPGKFIPVDDVDDMKVLSFQSNAHLFAGEEDRLWKYGEWLMATSPLSSGQVPSVVGPMRSTSGVLTLLQQMDKQFKPIVEHMAVSWKKLEKLLLEDLDERIGIDVKARVLGATLEEREMLQNLNYNMQAGENAQLLKNFDVSIDVTNALNSDEVKRNDASIVMQTMLSPTLAHQAGIIGPKAMHKAVRDYLLAYNLDPEQYIVEPKYIDEPLTAHQEIQACGQGQVPPMALTDQHMEKAQLLQTAMQSPDYMTAKTKGLFVMDVDTLMMQTIEKHLSLAEAMQVKGLPNPQGHNQEDKNKTFAGTSDQQGGQDPEKTTSREIKNERGGKGKEKAGGTEEGGGD